MRMILNLIMFIRTKFAHILTNTPKILTKHIQITQNNSE